MGQYDTYDTYDIGTERYRKKAVKRVPVKAKHKHVWKDVILKENILVFGFDLISYSAGKRCEVCGKLSIGFKDNKPVQVSESCRIQTPAGVFNIPQVLSEYQDLPVYEVDSIFNLKKGGNLVMLCD